MFYHNTTTEPTVMPETGFFYNQYCFGVFCIGFSIFFSEIVLKYIKITDSYDDDDHADEDEDEDEEEEREIYTDKYIDEFNLLNERILTDLDYLNLKKNSICETTPGGIVLLNYNKETDGFCYYTDKLKEITYDILETVARKFVIEYNCKQLYIKPRSAEPTNTDSEPTSADSEPTSADSEPNTNESKKQVFAKFKKYNTGGKGSVSKIKNLKPITEQVNRFRYKGKIYEYEMNKKNNNDTIMPSTTIDYATYKKNFLNDNKNM